MDVRRNAAVIAIWITLTTSALTGVVFAIRLEGRVDKQGDAIAAVEKTRADADAQLLQELRYIRERLDVLVDRGR